MELGGVNMSKDTEVYKKQHSKLVILREDSENYSLRRLVMTFNNGFGASCIWGTGSHTEHKYDGIYHNPIPIYMDQTTDIEIGPLNRNGNLDGMLMPDLCDCDDVLGYRTINEWVKILKRIRDLPKDFEPDKRVWEWEKDDNDDNDDNGKEV